MNKREPEITPEMAKMSPREVARLLAVTEVRALEVLAQMKTPGKPGRKRRVPGALVTKTVGKRITFYGPL